jgi:hypothetical protein
LPAIALAKAEPRDMSGHNPLSQVNCAMTVY